MTHKQNNDEFHYVIVDNWNNSIYYIGLLLDMRPSLANSFLLESTLHLYVCNPFCLKHHVVSYLSMHVM